MAACTYCLSKINHCFCLWKEERGGEYPRTSLGTDNMECSGHQVTFQFQLGLVRDKVTADTVDLNLKSLKSMACDFVAEKCPANGITRMQERVLLFKHDYQSTNILQVGRNIPLVRENL